jgi:UDP-N-acetylmuramoyl-L-alanyl-D-glutamate--2,6-diaminopimelate ligase
MPLLRELLLTEEILHVHGSLDVPVRRIVTDSREVQPGDLFVCLPGYRAEGGETRADRHDFVPIALQYGAAALLVERDVPVGDSAAVVVRVANCWSAAAHAACRLHRHPSRDMLTIGVTGTSGKTSTTYFLQSILEAAGHTVARIGTVEYRLGDQVRVAGQTTPEAPILQGLLREAVDLGCTAVVLEVSSHALALRRVDGIAFDIGIFTNLGHDHLNFHPDLEHYARSKARLFELLSNGGKVATAVVNADDPAGETMLRSSRARPLTYGVREHADIRATDVAMDMEGISFRAILSRRQAPVRLRHLGTYSVYNALAALAASEALGIDSETATTALASTPVVPGRFEIVEAGQDFVVVVDYAHKPEALAGLLASARQLNPRRLITVVGCGGDRDRAKRPTMGRIAAEHSDHVVVTSDNPRGEEPEAIIAEILEGVRDLDPHGQRHESEIDRARAIRRAVSLAQPGDMVIIAGKGHETYQLVAGRRLDFDDRAHARQAIIEVRDAAPSSITFR